MDLETITLKIPKSVEKEEILNILIDRALTKIEYYRSKCMEFEEKFGKKFEDVKKDINTKEENFELWDNFILWEGYLEAYKEWMKKYEDLKVVLQNNK